jgi:hypothetical protein
MVVVSKDIQSMIKVFVDNSGHTCIGGALRCFGEQLEQDFVELSHQVQKSIANTKAAAHLKATGRLLPFLCCICH